MRLFRFIGVDCYSSLLPLDEFLGIIREKKVFVYNVHFMGDVLWFESSIENYYKLSSCKGIEYIGTIGILGYVRRFLWIKRNLVILISCFLSLFLYSNGIWDLFIVGEDMGLVESLEISLKEKGIAKYSLFIDDEELSVVEELLKDEFFDEIEWINLIRNGDSLVVRFMPREKAIREEMEYESLVARKEAVVAYFEVLSGKKLVKVNDYVKVGDELVSPRIVDSFGKEKQIYVKGRVFGKTMYVLEEELLWPYDFEITKPFAYYRLLFSVRNHISKELNEDEEILTENILQFSQLEGTIKMKVQYTLYEDITRP